MKIKFLENNNLNKIEIFNFVSFFQTFNDVNKISIQRTLMNQLLKRIYFKGNLIDIGGGKKSNYINFLKCENYLSINIDKKISPDILIEVNEPFPIKNNYFDQCLLLNVLEHIYDWDFLFNEIKKILKKQGNIHIIIPFMYPIHGAPNDYKRVTSDYLKKFLKDNSFENIVISPLSYGPFTNSQLISYRHKLFNGFMCQISVILDKLFQTLFRKQYISYNNQCPLFYYVNAKLK